MARLPPAPLVLGAALALLVTAARLAQAQGTPAGDVPVQVAAGMRADVPVLLRNIGTAQPLASVLVRARVDGTLVQTFFTEGQDVKPGDLLALIDPRPYAAILQQAQAKKAADVAQLGDAQRDLMRTTNLARGDFASRQQLDTQQAAVAQLQATLAGDDATIAAAQLNLDFTRITAPMAGRAGLRLVDPGNLIHANDSSGIVTITEIHPISVIFTLPQSDLPAIQAALARGKPRVIAATEDDRTELARGTLATIDSVIDAATGTIRLKAIFPNEDSRLWPGQFVNARLEIETRRGALTVPSPAVQHGPDGLYLYVVKPDGTASVQPVEVLQDDGVVAVIGQGLDDGVPVVVAGQSRLQAGAHVEAAPIRSGS